MSSDIHDSCRECAEIDCCDLCALGRASIMARAVNLGPILNDSFHSKTKL